MAKLFRNAFDKLAAPLWMIFTVGSLSQLNVSLFALLIYAARIRDDFPRVLPFALAELSKVFLEGYFFFGQIMPVGSKGVFPPKERRENKRETAKVLSEFMFVKMLGVVAGGTALLIAGEAIPSRWVYTVSLVIAPLWGLVRFAKWVRQLIARDNRYEGLKEIQVASAGIAKLRARLSAEEQNELAILVYQSREVSRGTVINLVRFVCGGLVVSLIISVIQELLLRIPR